jgi:choline dehydrogenase-like flavoprotein
MAEHVDALVVGSGPGGCVTARVLAEAGLDVMLVEEGSWVQPGEVEPYSLAQMERQYRNAGLTVALGRPSVAYTEGCGAGGGSEINSGLYHRPSTGLLAGWRRDWCIDDLDSRVLQPYHEIIERELSVSPWPRAELPPPSDVLRRGAEALGWSGFDIPRWARYRQLSGEIQVDRQTMTRTYLPKTLAAGCRLLTNTRVGRLRTQNNRVEAAELASRVGDRLFRSTVRADHAFICGGAVQSAALLQRSGVRRNVGSNLSVHPTVKVVAEFVEEINTTPLDLPTYQVKEFGPWLSFGGSASRPALIALSLAENWHDFASAADRWRRQSVYYAAIQSVGRGRVHALPGFVDPVVTYRLTNQDLAMLRSGLARLMHLTLAAGATAVYPAYRDAPIVTGPIDVARATAAMTRSRASLMTVHLTGTVPLGEDIRRCAADSHGRLHGYENLFVNDASMLPNAPGINPQGTLMAIAHRNVAFFLANH